MYVTIQAKLIYCVIDGCSARVAALTPASVALGPGRVTSMILRHPRAEHDDQSETDSQSQVSEGANTAPQAGPQKRKARVCMDKTVNDH
jgi:hypothetical protein